jgi:DNA repair exonuclease SbcCD ATPase subunit
VNGLLKNTEQLNLTVSKQLDKVGDIGTIVENFDTNAQGLVAGSKYLESHFQNFDQREQTISNKIADFDSKTGDMVDELKKSFEERLKTFNEKDVDINSGFEELFANLKETTAQVFEDESQNIGAIKKEMAVVSERVNRMQSIPSNVDELDKRIKSQNESLEKLVEKIADKPLVFKPPKLLIIFFIVIGLIIIATCGLFIYKYIL